MEKQRNIPSISHDSSTELRSIEGLIYVIRGQQVMIDRDLARLYEVETRRLNEQVKRNIDRFPEDFMFQLSKEEAANLMSQIATSSARSYLSPSNKRVESSSSSNDFASNWGGRRKLPYAFTENGVAMLSSVLRSKPAIETNIRIMRAFTAMRSFFITNAHIFRRLEIIEHNQLLVHNHLSDHDRKIEDILTGLEDKVSSPIEGCLYDGQIFDAYTLISDLVRAANDRIILIDNYIDDSVLKTLDKRKANVRALIYTNPRNSHIHLDLKKHNAQYPEIKLQPCLNVHDRFLIIDNVVYFIGGSITDLGKKIVAFSRMHQTPEDILEKIK